jgi:hypothetical protein
MSEVRFRVRSQAAKEANMQVVHRRWAGPDVPKESNTATFPCFPTEEGPEVRTEEFRTYWKDLQRLALRLAARSLITSIFKRILNPLVRRPKGLGLQVVIILTKPTPGPASPGFSRGPPSICLERAMNCDHKQL